MTSILLVQPNYALAPIGFNADIRSYPITTSFEEALVLSNFPTYIVEFSVWDLHGKTRSR